MARVGPVDVREVRLVLDLFANERVVKIPIARVQERNLVARLQIDDELHGLRADPAASGRERVEILRGEEP